MKQHRKSEVCHALVKFSKKNEISFSCSDWSKDHQNENQFENFYKFAIIVEKILTKKNVRVVDRNFTKKLNVRSFWRSCEVNLRSSSGHVAACKNERKFVCDKCGMSFNQANNLKKHAKKHSVEHQQKKELNYVSFWRYHMSHIIWLILYESFSGK